MLMAMKFFWLSRKFIYFQPFILLFSFFLRKKRKRKIQSKLEYLVDICCKTFQFNHLLFFFTSFFWFCFCVFPNTSKHISFHSFIQYIYRFIHRKYYWLKLNFQINSDTFIILHKNMIFVFVCFSRSLISIYKWCVCVC